VSRSSQLILRVCLVAVAGWLLVFLATYIAADAGLVLLPVLLLGPPVLACVLAYAVARAARDLLRQPELRTPVNIVVALVGAIALLAGAWWWYLGMSQHNAAF
jgi:F0F1-type ATP synthase membrane subunit c/vacuolar-type H+-ATPase subunit K